MTNAISDFLCVDCVDADLAVANKKALFHKLGASAARRLDLDARDIATALADRERLGSTGFGHGVAIPHGKLDALPALFGFFARLSEPIDFQAADKLPVDMIVLLLSPSDAGAEHLKALARISRVLRDAETLAKLRGARSRDAIYALLTGAETRHAA